MHSGSIVIRMSTGGQKIDASHAIRADFWASLGTRPYRLRAWVLGRVELAVAEQGDWEEDRGRF